MRACLIDERDKPIPVRKLNCLVSKKLSTHITVELYESAAYGHAPEFTVNGTEGTDDYGFSFSGVDAAKELYHYDIIGRVLMDGRCIDLDLMTEEIPFQEKEDTLFISYVSTGEYEPEAEALCETMELTHVAHDHILMSVSVRRPVNIPYYYYSVILSASYLDDQTVPVLVEDYTSYESNDGGTYNYHFHVVNDGSFDLSAAMGQSETLTTIKEGEGTLNGLPREWSVQETSTGAKIVTVVTKNPNEMTGYICTYLYLDKNLILIREEWFC